MIEKAFKFGRLKHLVGVVTQPDDSKLNKKFALLFLNAGILSRVGPYRLHVDLARQIAGNGILSMRFDLSGIGDSMFTNEKIAYKKQVLLDVQNAIDLLQQLYGIERFVLAGICSGAINSHLVATKDCRITGLVLMDGFVYKTKKFYYIHYKPYLINHARMLSGIKSLAKRKLQSMFQEKQETGRGSMFFNTVPPKKQIANDFNLLVSRGVSLLCIYSGGISGRYNYQNQFVDAFSMVNFKGRLQLHYFEKADHTYTSATERGKMMRCIGDWLTHFSLL